jgi:hypothetical protein
MVIGKGDGAPVRLFFWAERHVTASNFHIETTLDLINCAVDVAR